MSKDDTRRSLRGIKRPDAVTKHKAVVIEKSGTVTALRGAVRELEASGKPQKVLIVPAKSLYNAKKAMREAGVSGTVRNLRDTHRSYVEAKTSEHK